MTRKKKALTALAVILVLAMACGCAFLGYAYAKAQAAYDALYADLHSELDQQLRNISALNAALLDAYDEALSEEATLYAEDDGVAQLCSSTTSWLLSVRYDLENMSVYIQAALPEDAGQNDLVDVVTLLDFCIEVTQDIAAAPDMTEAEIRELLSPVTAFVSQLQADLEAAEGEAVYLSGFDSSLTSYDLEQIAQIGASGTYADAENALQDAVRQSGALTRGEE